MINVVVVDDQEFARIGIERVLDADPGITLIASVSDISKFDFTTADVDAIILGAADAEGAARDLRAAPVPRPAVVIWRAVDSLSALSAALRSGPLGLISGTTSAAELLFAVDAVSRGGSYISSELVGGMGAVAGGKPPLAPRELETAKLVAQGLTHRQIARRMGLTEATVSTYVKRLRTKLNAGNKAELTRKVIEQGYVPLDR